MRGKQQSGDYVVCTVACFQFIIYEREALKSRLSILFWQKNILQKNNKFLKYFYHNCLLNQNFSIKVLDSKLNFKPFLMLNLNVIILIQ